MVKQIGGLAALHKATSPCGPPAQMNNTNSAPPASWQSWFRTHGSRLLLFARQQTRTSEDAEDVLQEAMVRLWKSGMIDQAENGSPEPCLAGAFTQIRRAAVDQARRNIRRANRENRAMELDGASDAVWFQDTIEQDERSQQIEAAIQTLPDYYKEVIILKIWGELTFDQIAETLDIPMNTAASRYRYALEKLRRTLTPAKLAS
jgi:RNA polymerase sigma factor (sigma-70 family)